jgi:cytochrome c5
MVCSPASPSAPSRAGASTLPLLRRSPGGRRRPARLALLLVLCAGTGAWAQAPESPTRGRLLYETHCIACHNTQVHWRDQRLAQDWAGLVTQVRAWQARATLGWSDADVVEVARHLNDTIYRFERPVAARGPAMAARTP